MLVEEIMAYTIYIQGYDGVREEQGTVADLESAIYFIEDNPEMFENHNPANGKGCEVIAVELETGAAFLETLTEDFEHDSWDAVEECTSL
jgi:hypothetical protein